MLSQHACLTLSITSCAGSNVFDVYMLIRGRLDAPLLLLRLQIREVLGRQRQTH